MNLRQFIEPAAKDLTAQLETEIREAAEHFLGTEFTLADVRARFRFIAVDGTPGETLYFDAQPVLQVYPVESEIERTDTAVIVRMTRRYRRIWTAK